MSHFDDNKIKTNPNTHPNAGCICHLDQFQSIKEEWLDIYNGTSEKSPFLSFEFLNLWYKCFAEPDQVRVYRAHDGERTIGFLPLIFRRKYGVRILNGLTNDHCLHSQPLVRKGYEEVFLELILNELLRDRNSWDLFIYNFSYSFSELPGLFPEEMLVKSDIKWERKYEPTYTVSLNKSFEEYFNKDLSDNFRSTIKKLRNKLKKEESFRTVHCRGDKAVEHWAELLRLEDSGWKGKSGSSILKVQHEFKEYYEGLVRLLASMDLLKMHFLEINGKNIAGGFGYIEGNIYHYAKAGYDEQFSALSPSNLLMIYIIEHLMANYPEIKRFHMFPWDHGYKHRFANEEAHCIETVLFSPSIRGKTLTLAYNFSDMIKKMALARPAINSIRRIIKFTRVDR